MHSSSLELGRKRVKLNVCESFKYFPQKLLRKYLKKKYLFFSKVQFHHEGGLSESRNFEFFFFNSLRNPTTQKSDFTEAPFLLFVDGGERGSDIRLVGSGDVGHNCEDQ